MIGDMRELAPDVVLGEQVEQVAPLSRYAHHREVGRHQGLAAACCRCRASQPQQPRQSESPNCGLQRQAPEV